jgi:peptidoglycan hydrolase-like protein with peptidoglycan-binding domain
LVKLNTADVSAPAKTTYGFTFAKQMKYGDYNSDVKELQTLLQKLGYFSKLITPNGNYGPATQASVVAFQKAVGFKTWPGDVGPKTLVKLNTAQ